MKRRRRRYEEMEEEAVELGDVLEPYQQPQWQDEPYVQDSAMQDPYVQGYVDGYYDEEYSDEHEAVDHEGRFRIAMGMFDLVSIFLGILVILALVAMLFTLFNWLRSDIQHSALLLQSGLQ